MVYYMNPLLYSSKWPGVSTTGLVCSVCAKTRSLVMSDLVVRAHRAFISIIESLRIVAVIHACSAMIPHGPYRSVRTESGCWSSGRMISKSPHPSSSQHSGPATQFHRSEDE